jgi:hypothetical protein
VFCNIIASKLEDQHNHFLDFIGGKRDNEGQHRMRRCGCVVIDSCTRGLDFIYNGLSARRITIDDGAIAVSPK